MAEENPQGVTEPERSGAKAEAGTPSFGGRVARWVFSGVGIVIVLAAIAWVMAAPKGELRLALDKSIDSSSKAAIAARTAFTLANAHLTAAERYHSILSFKTYDPNTPLVHMPLSERPNTTTLSDIIQEAHADASIAGGGSSFKISVQIVRLLETLYDLVNWRDYFVYVRSVAPCDEGGPECYQMVLSLSPYGDGTPELKGSLDVIAGDLSVYVLRSIMLHENNLWQAKPETNNQPTPYLFAVSVPTHLPALANAAVGMDILLRGTGHPDCVSRTRENCLEHARELLVNSVDPDKDGVAENPSAALGLSLIATERGFEAARDLASESEVQRNFQDAERWMQVARQSKFLRDEIAKPDFVSKFKGLVLGQLKLDDDFYQNTGSFVCALESNRRARWADCLKRIGAITNFPEPLEPYLEATKFYAALQSATDATARADVLAQIERRLAKLQTDATLTFDQQKLRTWSLDRILVLDGCIHPDAARNDALSNAAEAYIKKAPGAEALEVAHADVAGCAFGAELVPPETIRSLEQNLWGAAGESHYRLAFAWAKYHVRVHEYDQALSLLKEAMALPYVGAYVTAAPEFDEFMRDDRYGPQFLQAYLVMLPKLGEQNC